MTSHTTPGSITPAPSVAAISSPAPGTTRSRAVEAGGVAQPVADRAEHRVRRPTGAIGARSTSNASHASSSHSRARGSSRLVEDAFEGSTARDAGRAPGHPRARQEEGRRRTVDVGLVTRQPRDLRRHVPRSRLQPVSSRSRSGSMRQPKPSTPPPRAGRTRSAPDAAAPPSAFDCHKPVKLRAEGERGDLAPGGLPRAPAQRAAIRAKSSTVRGPARPSRRADSWSACGS